MTDIILLLIEEMQSEAPYKEPPSMDTVSSPKFSDECNDAIHDAFNQGRDRALWEIKETCDDIYERVNELINSYSSLKDAVSAVYTKYC